MSGLSAMKSTIIDGTSVSVAEVFAKITNVDRRPSEYRANSERIRAICPTTSRAWATSSQPAGDGTTPRRCRINSGAPRAFSIALILALAEASDRCDRSAPRVMLPWSTTCRNS